ncbi:hypothetical protein [Achromobacter aloeverae]
MTGSMAVEPAIDRAIYPAIHPRPPAPPDPQIFFKPNRIIYRFALLIHGAIVLHPAIASLAMESVEKNRETE